MVQYDEAHMLYVVTEELAKITRDLGSAISPNVPASTKAELLVLDARLSKLQEVAIAYVIPPATLAQLRADLQFLLNQP